MWHQHWFALNHCVSDCTGINHLHVSPYFQTAERLILNYLPQAMLAAAQWRDASTNAVNVIIYWPRDSL